FLLGDNGKRVREARAIVLHEEATQMSRAEIRLFLERYALRVKNRQIPQNELDQLTDYVIRGLSWPYDHTSMELIGEQLEMALGMSEAAAAAAPPAGAGLPGPPPAGIPLPPPPAGGPVAPPPGG